MGGKLFYFFLRMRKGSWSFGVSTVRIGEMGMEGRV